MFTVNSRLLSSYINWIIKYPTPIDTKVVIKLETFHQYIQRDLF